MGIRADRPKQHEAHGSGRRRGYMRKRATLVGVGAAGILVAGAGAAGAIGLIVPDTTHFATSNSVWSAQSNHSCSSTGCFGQVILPTASHTHIDTISLTCDLPAFGGKGPAVTAQINATIAGSWRTVSVPLTTTDDAYTATVDGLNLVPDPGSSVYYTLTAPNAVQCDFTVLGNAIP
jgi:hypothetical protein